MPQLFSQFAQALRNIEPSGDDKANAPAAHREVRDALRADEQLMEWGLDPVLIGSYKRHVSIRRMKDVDLFGRLPDIPDDVEPATLLAVFERVLKEAFGSDRVKRQARSLQVEFPDLDGLYVDAVPARPWTSAYGEHAWQLPKREGDGWQATNPERLSAISTELNDEFGEDYVPVVKLLRQTRRSLLGNTKPGGLTIEIAAVHAFRSGAVSGASVGDLYASALAKTGAMMYSAFVLGSGLDDPTLVGEKLVVRGSDADKRALAEAFVAAGAKAQAAIASDHKCAAAKTIRGLLGKAVDDQGDQDHVFPMPDYCNLDGTAKSFSRVRAGDSPRPVVEARSDFLSRRRREAVLSACAVTTCVRLVDRFRPSDKLVRQATTYLRHDSAEERAPFVPNLNLT